MRRTLVFCRGRTPFFVGACWQGLQRGIISPALFTTLVIMAVVTTLMASPIFDWLVGRHRDVETVA